MTYTSFQTLSVEQNGMTFPYEKLPIEVHDILDAVRKPAWRGLLSEYHDEKLGLQERVTLCWSRIPEKRRLALPGEIAALLRKHEDNGWQDRDGLALLRALESLASNHDAPSAQEAVPTDCALGQTSTDISGYSQALGFDLYPEAGALPTAFVRSAVFSDPAHTPQIFDVLGMPSVKVERSGPALGETQLLVLAYLVSLVQGYDGQDGALVEFVPWEAVRMLRWTRSSQSVARLEKALHGLAETRVRIIQDVAQASQAAPPLCLSEGWRDDKRWRVQLTAAFILDLEAYHTYARLDVLHKLPNGVATRLYLFLCSERHRSTTWPMRELARLAGLTSIDEHHVKAKLQQALTVLVEGVHCVKARGMARSKRDSHVLGMPFPADALLPTASAKFTVHTFPPILAAFDFRRDRHGRWRVLLEKTAAVVKGSTASVVKGSKKIVNGSGLRS